MVHAGLTVEYSFAQVCSHIDDCSILESWLKVHGLTNIKLGLNKDRIRTSSFGPVLRVSGKLACVVATVIAESQV